MGGEQAAGVLTTVERESKEARGIQWPAEEEQKLKVRQWVRAFSQLKDKIIEKYEAEGHPYYSSARLWDDGIIDPMDTRRVLGQALSVSMNADVPRDTDFGVFRM